MAARSLLTFRSYSSYLVLSKRLFSSSSSSSIARVPHLPIFSRHVRSTVSLPHFFRSAVRLTTIRCCGSGCGGGDYSGDYIDCGFSGIVDPEPIEDEIDGISGRDFEHWLIVMNNPGGKDVSNQQTIQCSVETLAKVLGSEEEAKKKIYSIHSGWKFAFGCQVDKETAIKLRGLPGVRLALPDSYRDEENKDYGGELYVNGEIVERSPERKKRLIPVDITAKEFLINNPEWSKNKKKQEKTRTQPDMWSSIIITIALLAYLTIAILTIMFFVPIACLAIKFFRSFF